MQTVLAPAGTFYTFYEGDKCDCPTRKKNGMSANAVFGFHPSTLRYWCGICRRGTTIASSKALKKTIGITCFPLIGVSSVLCVRNSVPYTYIMFHQSQICWTWTQTCIFSEVALWKMFDNVHKSHDLIFKQKANILISLFVNYIENWIISSLPYNHKKQREISRLLEVHLTTGKLWLSKGSPNFKPR